MSETLTRERLDQIEEQARERGAIVVAELCAALRTAWQERDQIASAAQQGIEVLNAALELAGTRMQQAERERDQADERIQAERERAKEADDRAAQAEADAAALHGLVSSVIDKWADEGEFTPFEEEMEALAELLTQEHSPGAALLAELAAARALAEAIKEHPGCLVDDETLDAALTAYEQTRKEATP